MPVDIRQALLKNSEDSHLDVPRQPSDVGLNFSIHANAAAFGESLHVPFDGGLQSHLLEHRRIQEIRDGANLADAFVRNPNAFGELIAGALQQHM